MTLSNYLKGMELAACRRKTSEVSNDIFARTVTWIIQPIWRQNHLLRLPRSSKIALSDRLLVNRKDRNVVNLPQKLKPTAGKTRRLQAFQFYAAGVSGLGVALLFWSMSHLPSSRTGLLLFIGLVILAELTTSETITPTLFFSMSSACVFATLLLFGSLPAALAAMAGGLVTTLVTDRRERRQGKSVSFPVLQRTPFNMASLGLAAPVAGGIYVLSGGKIGEVALLSNLLPMALAAVAYELVNAGLVFVLISLRTGQPALRIWSQNLSWITPMNILTMVVGGGGLALGYQIAGILGAGVFFLPLVLTIYAYRLYVAQTKAHMARLERIVTERTQDLQKANEELKRLDQVKTGFFSMINHEMRTPLTAILGYTELLLSVHGNNLSADQQHMLHHIRDGSGRLIDLVNNILDISRIEDGRMAIVPEPMGLLPAVREALAVIRPMADSKHIAISVDVSPEIPEVWGDSKRVSQILVNLLSNAVKYTPNTGKVAVAARRNRAFNMVEVSVTDTGIGIPADQLPYVFDRFSRIERPEIQNVAGTGLGLSIAHGLAEAHGGKIWVESEEARGTCFTFTLPIAEQASPEAIPPESREVERVELIES
jgi:signal transduction histidine kinase